MNDETLILRPVQMSDVPQVQRLIDEIFQEYDCKLDALQEDTHLLAPGPYFRVHGGEFWVVARGAEILATVAVKMLPPEAAELKTLYVAKSLRRHGWGRKLSELVMDYARARGRQRMILWSDTRFTDAHRLYEKLGFQATGEIRDLHDSNNSLEYGYTRRLAKQESAEC